MKRSLLTFFCAGSLAVSCATASTADKYTVTLPLTEDEDGLTAYIISFDTGEKIDSTVVADGKAVFAGEVTTPTFARIILDGNRAGMLVLEPGTISANATSRLASGTPTNDAMTQLSKSRALLKNSFALLATAPHSSRKRKS